MHSALRAACACALSAFAAGCGDAAVVTGTGLTEVNSSTPPELSNLNPPNANSTEPEDAGHGGLEFDPQLGRFIMPDAGKPDPKPMPTGERLPVDQLHSEEQMAVILTASFRQRNVAQPTKSPELSPHGVEDALTLTAPVSSITLTGPGRMRWVVQSRAMPLPFQAEIRAREDRYGHLIFWSSKDRYRIIPAGAIRTTLGEQRVDVTPLSPGNVASRATGKRFDLPTRIVNLESPLGKLKLEIAPAQEAGLGGPLLCRTLVELIGIDPASPECKIEEVPVFAAIDWEGGGGIDLEVTAMERRIDLPGGEALVPPPGAELADEGLPTAPDGIYLTQPELANMHVKGGDITRDPEAPIDGFIAENGRDRFMMFYLDGVPVVGVPPLSTRFVVGPIRGHYTTQWRSFLGDHIDEPKFLEMPGYYRNVSKKDEGDAGVPAP